MLRSLGLALVFFLTAGASAAAQNAQVAGNGPGTPVATSLLPGDVIRIQIWREEGLSGDFQVDEGGEVVLPLLGRK